MARKYAQIQFSLWMDDDFLDLSPSAQYLFFVLLSSPTMNYAGVDSWHPRRLSKKSRGWTVEAIEAAAAELIDAHFIVVDVDTDECLVRTFVRNDPFMKQPNLAVTLANDMAGIASRALRQVVSHELNRLYEEHSDWGGWRKDQAMDLLKARQVDARTFPCGNPYAHHLSEVKDSDIVTPADGGAALFASFQDPSVNPQVKGDVYPTVDPYVDPTIDPKPKGRAKGYRKGCPTTATTTTTSNYQGEDVSTFRTEGASVKGSPDLDTGGFRWGNTPPASITPTSLPEDLDAPLPPEPDDHAPDGTQPWEPATPDQWSTPDNPRCRAHANHPGDPPACQGCKQVREWFQGAAKREKQARRAAITACGHCDDNGKRDIGAPDHPRLITCNHQPTQHEATPSTPVNFLSLVS